MLDQLQGEIHLLGTAEPGIVFSEDTMNKLN